jgi:hypothetical protein
MKLGRTPSPHRAKLCLMNFIDLKKLPTPPPSVNYSEKAAKAIAEVYCNDELGDCVIAGGYHLVGVWTANADGEAFIATREQIIADYSAIGGYDGTPESDQGCNEQAALKYWINNGFADGSKLAGFVGVDATNVDEVMTAIYLFEDLLLGIELPDAWIADYGLKVWDVAGEANPDNGHCVVVVGYDGLGVQIATWGMVKTITWAALAKYCSRKTGGEIYALLSPDELRADSAPNGFDFKTLKADLNALRFRS